MIEKLLAPVPFEWAVRRDPCGGIVHAKPPHLPFVPESYGPAFDNPTWAFGVIYAYGSAHVCFVDKDARVSKPINVPLDRSSVYITEPMLSCLSASKQDAIRESRIRYVEDMVHRRELVYDALAAPWPLAAHQLAVSVWTATEQERFLLYVSEIRQMDFEQMSPKLALDPGVIEAIDILNKALAAWRRT